MKKIRFNWKIWVPSILGALVILCVLGFFLVTSSFFVKKVILPVAGNMLSLDLKVDSVKVGLSHSEFVNMEVTPRGEETIVKAARIAASYDLKRMITSGFSSFVVPNVELDKAWINIVQTPEGGNLAALIAGLNLSESEESGGPIHLALDNVAVKDSTVKWKAIAELEDGAQSWMGAVLDDVNATVTNLGTGRTGDVALTCGTSFLMGSNIKNDVEHVMGSALDMNLKVPLTQEFKPGLITGSVKCDFADCKGDIFSALKGYGITLDLEASLEEIQKFVLKFNSEKENLLDLSVTGSMDWEKMSVELAYKLSELDYRLINVFTAASGLAIEKTFVNSEGSIKVADFVKYNVKSVSHIKEFLLTDAKEMPAVSLDADVDISADLESGDVVVSKLLVNGVQGTKQFVSTELSQPLTINLNAAEAKNIPDSHLKANLALDMQDWCLVLGDTNIIGKVLGDLDVTVTGSGQKVALNSSVSVNQLNMMGISADGKLQSQLNVALGNDIVSAGSVNINNFNVGMADFNLTNFILNVDYDVAVISNNIIDINKLELGLAPTKLADNKVLINGRLALPQDGAIKTPCTLSVTSTGLDLIKEVKMVMDKFMGAKETEQVAEVKTETPASTDSSASLAPIELPIKDFEGKVLFNAIYAMDNLAVTNLNLVTSIKENMVVANLNSLEVDCGTGATAKLKANTTVNLTDLSTSVDYDLSGVNAALLNAFLEEKGLKLDKTAIASSGLIKVSDNFNQFQVQNKATVKELVVVRDNPTPAISLDSDLDVSADLAKQVFTATKIYAKGTLGEKEFVSANTSKPLVVGWGKDMPKDAEDSLLDVLLNVDLQDIKDILNDAEAAGNLNAKLGVTVADAGKKLKMQGDFNLNSVSVMGYKMFGSITATNDFSQSADENLFKGFLNINKLALESSALSFTNFDFKTAYDVAMPVGAVNLRQFDIVLTPTDRAPENMVSIVGNVNYADMTLPAKLNISSKTLDLTQILSWFIKESSATTEETTEEVAEQKDEENHSLPLPKENPAAIDIPLKDFTCSINMGAVYLDKVYVTNVNTKLTLKNNVIEADAGTMSVNGGDASGKLKADLNHPGYLYSLECNAPAVPIGEVVDTLKVNIPGELRGQLIACGSISGAGITEKDIQQNLVLNGQYGLTNVSFVVVNKAYRAFLSPILMGLRISDLASSPIVGIYADLKGDKGKLEIVESRVSTDAFQVKAAGVMEFSPVLMDTPLDLPVDIFLAPEVAQKSNLGTDTTVKVTRKATKKEDAEENAEGSKKDNTKDNGGGEFEVVDFYAMPHFVKIIGTPSSVSVDIDKVVLAGLMLKSGTGIVKDVGGVADKLVGGVGGVLLGEKNTNGVRGVVKGVGNLMGLGGSDTDSVDGSSTNESKGLGKAIKGIGGLLGGGSKGNTNTSEVNQPTDMNSTTNTTKESKGLGGLLKLKK